MIEVKTSLEELERLREKYNLMNAKHRDILNKIDELRRRKEELDKELRELLHGKDLLQMKNLRDQLRDEYERLESLVRYFESAQNLIKLKLELKELEGSEEKLRELEREISGKEELLRKLREDLENITQDLGNLDPTIKELEILENARKRILMLLESYPSIDELKGQVEKTSMEIEEIERKLKQREEEIAYMQALISELKEKIDKLKGSSICPVCGRPLSPEERDRKIKEYSNELNVLQSRLSTYYSEYKKLKVRLEELWSLRERLKSKYDSIQAILNSFSVENLDELNQNIFQLYFIISSIAENNVTTIEEARRVRSKLVRRRDELNEKIKALDREIREIQRQKENLLGRVVKRNKILEEIRKIESILPSDPQEIIDSYSKYAEVKRKLVELEDKVQKASNIRSRIEEIEERLKPLLREEESLREEINQLGFNEDEYNKLKELYEKLTDEITQLEKEVSATNRLLQEYKKRLDEIESLRNEMKVIDLEIIKVESFVQFLRTLRKDLSDKIPSKLMNYLRENWNIEASNILRSFETSISNVYIDENWNVIAYSPLGEIDVGMLSGGEKVSVALALKLALLRLFTETPIQFMILDEPTIYLDSERKKRLRR